MVKRGGNSLHKTVFCLSLLFCIILITSCDFYSDSYASIEADTLTPGQTEAMLKAEAIAQNDTFPFIRYRHSMIRDKEHRDIVYKEYLYDGNNWSKNKTFRTLHREELIYLRAGEKLVIPDTFISDQRAFSIFPAFYWEARHIPKIVIVSNAFQAYAAYQYGRLVRFAATNTGKEATQTYPGRYSMVWKKREHKSSLDSNWIMPYNFNYHSNAGNAFHQFTMPGRPVSHSCCRQFMDDARWLFYWGEGYKRGKNGKIMRLSGTPVIIIDYFDFSRKRGGPWLELTSNKDTILPLPKDPMAVEWALIPICQIPENSRWNLPGGLKRYIHAEDTLRAKGIIRPHVNLIKTRNFNAERRRKQAIEEKKKKMEEAKSIMVE